MSAAVHFQLVTREGCTEGACLDVPGGASVCVGECILNEDCPASSRCEEVQSYDSKKGLGSSYRVCVPN